VKFQIVTAAKMKMVVFWESVPCNLVTSVWDRPVMEAGSISETSVNFYQVTLRNSPEDSHLQRIVYFKTELLL
jgi:hypothetical protein